MNLLFALLLLLTPIQQDQDTTSGLTEAQMRRAIEIAVQQIRRELLTTYTTQGVPTTESQYGKGWHRQWGAATLAAGSTSVTINATPSEGKQDVSFIDSTTYHGMAWSLDTSNTNTYRVFPISGTQFLIKSSDAGDASTVRYVVEGE